MRDSDSTFYESSYFGGSTGKRTFKPKQPPRGIKAMERCRLRAPILLERFALERMGGAAQFLGALCLQLFMDFWGKDFFRAKRFLSLPRSTMANPLYRLTQQLTGSYFRHRNLNEVLLLS
jgi:hypothetical protein